MAVLEFTTLSRDADGMLELQVTVQGNGLIGTHKAYVYPDELNAFGAALQSYPFSETKEAVLEAGSLDPDWYGYMRLRVFLLSGFGRSALEMQYDTRGELPDRASGTFYVAGEPAEFSRLGEEICRFASGTAQSMRNEWRDA
ncbi:MAG: hypothetical protein WDO12_08840 [Pseudomonadota bacterium]